MTRITDMDKTLVIGNTGISEGEFFEIDPLDSDTSRVFGIYDNFGNEIASGSSDGVSLKSLYLPSYGKVIDSDGTWLGSGGVRGYTGSSGADGFVGSMGFTGSSGFVGSGGSIGFTGSRGLTGTGTVGFTGSQGDTGFVGSTGNIGFTGSRGIEGPIGFTGSRGATGSTGFTGSKGDLGNIGFSGSRGTTGFTGSKGDVGNTGFTGSHGTTGATGYTGSSYVRLDSYFDNSSPGNIDARAGLQSALDDSDNYNKYIHVDNDIQLKQGVTIDKNTKASGIIFHGATCYINFNDSDGFRNTDASVERTTGSCAFLIYGDEGYGTPARPFRIENLKAQGINRFNGNAIKFDMVSARNALDFEFINGRADSLGFGYLVKIDSCRGKCFVHGAKLTECIITGTASNQNSARAQISVVMLDRDRMTNGAETEAYNTEPMSFKNIEGINLYQDSDAYDQSGYQSDVITLVGDGDGFHRVQGVYGRNVDEVVDVQTDGNNISDVVGINIFGATLKIFNGASYNKVTNTYIRGWWNRCVQFGGQAGVGWNSPKWCEHNIIDGITAISPQGPDNAPVGGTAASSTASFIHYFDNTVDYGNRYNLVQNIYCQVGNMNYFTKEGALNIGNILEFKTPLTVAESAALAQQFSWARYNDLPAAADTIKYVASDIVTAYRSSNQTIPSGSTRIEFDAASVNRYGNFLLGSSARYRSTAPGFYNIDVQLRVTSNADITLAAYNQSDVQLLATSNASSDSLFRLTGKVFLEADEWVDFWAINGSGASRTAVGTLTYCHVEGPL
jgi:hypothetical protein